MQEFDSTIMKLQSEDDPALELCSVMNRFRFQLKAHHADKFYGSKTRQALRHHLPQEREHFRTLTEKLFEKAAL